MKKIVSGSLALLFFCINIYGQDSSVIANKDSSTTQILNDLMGLLDTTDVSSSYVSVNVGIGNRLFSVKNNSLNSKQSSAVTTIFSPSVSYYHKSGLSISAGANLLNDVNKGFGVNQYSVTPAFDLLNNDAVDFGISYSHYFIKDKYSSYSSPIQNDFYTYVTYKKTWIQPGIAFGFSSGEFKEIFRFNTLTKLYVDTGTYKINTFSMIATAGHRFEWANVFGNGDGLSFNPTFQLNLGSDSTKSISHTISRADLIALHLELKSLRREFKKLGLNPRFARLQGSNSFQAQSLGLDLGFSYSIAHFTIQPQLYLDYYLPKTEEKRLSTIFAINFGYSF